MRPKLVIAGTDFSALTASITPSNNDLDADGSGRDIQTGTMYRTKITDKDKLEVSMMRLWETDMAALQTALDPAFIQVTYLNPRSNTETTKTMYCSSISHGLQMYDRYKGKTYYEGASFSLMEQ